MIFLKDNTPSLEANTPSLEANTPSLEANTPSLEDNTSSLEANTPSLEANTPSLEANTPSLEDNSSLSFLPFGSMIEEIVDAVYDINVKYHGKDTADQFHSHDICDFKSQITELEDILQTQKLNYPISNETIEKFIETFCIGDYPNSDIITGIPQQQAADLLFSICKIMVKHNL